MDKAFLLAMTSVTSVSMLHALSVGHGCLQQGSGVTGVTLWPNPSFLPMVLPSSYVNVPLRLAAFNSPALEGDGEDTDTLLCPVRAFGFFCKGDCRSSAVRLPGCLPLRA